MENPKTLGKPRYKESEANATSPPALKGLAAKKILGSPFPIRLQNKEQLRVMKLLHKQYLKAHLLFGITIVPLKKTRMKARYTLFGQEYTMPCIKYPSFVVPEYGGKETAKFLHFHGFLLVPVQYYSQTLPNGLEVVNERPWRRDLLEHLKLQGFRIKIEKELQSQDAWSTYIFKGLYETEKWWSTDKKYWSDQTHLKNKIL